MNHLNRICTALHRRAATVDRGVQSEEAPQLRAPGSRYLARISCLHQQNLSTVRARWIGIGLAWEDKTATCLSASQRNAKYAFVLPPRHVVEVEFIAHPKKDWSMISFMRCPLCGTVESCHRSRVHSKLRIRLRNALLRPIWDAPHIQLLREVLKVICRCIWPMPRLSVTNQWISIISRQFWNQFGIGCTRQPTPRSTTPYAPNSKLDKTFLFKWPMV